MLIQFIKNNKNINNLYSQKNKYKLLKNDNKNTNIIKNKKEIQKNKPIRVLTFQKHYYVINIKIMLHSNKKNLKALNKINEKIKNIVLLKNPTLIIYSENSINFSYYVYFQDLSILKNSINQRIELLNLEKIIKSNSSIYKASFDIYKDLNFNDFGKVFNYNKYYLNFINSSLTTKKDAVNLYNSIQTIKIKKIIEFMKNQQFNYLIFLEIPNKFNFIYFINYFNHLFKDFNNHRVLKILKKYNPLAVEFFYIYYFFNEGINYDKRLNQIDLSEDCMLENFNTKSYFVVLLLFKYKINSYENLKIFLNLKYNEYCFFILHNPNDINILSMKEFTSAYFCMQNINNPKEENIKKTKKFIKSFFLKISKSYELNFNKKNYINFKTFFEDNYYPVYLKNFLTTDVLNEHFSLLPNKYDEDDENEDDEDEDEENRELYISGTPGIGKSFLFLQLIKKIYNNTYEDERNIIITFPTIILLKSFIYDNFKYFFNYKKIKRTIVIFSGKKYLLALENNKIIYKSLPKHQLIFKIAYQIVLTTFINYINHPGIYNSKRFFTTIHDEIDTSIIYNNIHRYKNKRITNGLNLNSVYSFSASYFKENTTKQPYFIKKINTTNRKTYFAEVTKMNIEVINNILFKQLNIINTNKKYLVVINDKKIIEEITKNKYLSNFDYYIFTRKSKITNINSLKNYKFIFSTNVSQNGLNFNNFFDEIIIFSKHDSDTITLFIQYSKRERINPNLILRIFKKKIKNLNIVYKNTVLKQPLLTYENIKYYTELTNISKLV